MCICLHTYIVSIAEREMREGSNGLLAIGLILSIDHKVLPSSGAHAVFSLHQLAAQLSEAHNLTG